MSLINVSNLTFAYNGSYDNVFEQVSFQIDTDWRLGFTGRNGRGKTTFLQLLMGQHEYRGTISASVGFDYFPFPVADSSQNTIELLERLDPDLAQWQLERELSLLELHEEVLYRPFDTLSQGEQTKVLLASLFVKEDRFLLIDEPTNHLDSAARLLVSNYLKSKKGFILVSHDRAFLDHCIDHILVINKTDIDIQKGNFASWWNNKQNRDHFEQAENEKLQRDIQKLSAAAQRTASWSDKVESSKHKPLKSGLSADKGYIGHKSAKMMKRAKAAETRRLTAADEKSKLLKNVERSDRLLIRPLEYPTDRLAEFCDITVRYGNKTACEPVSFVLRRGDRIALQGKNGSGKSSLLKLILGESIPHSGELFLGSNLRVSYVSQDTSHLCGNLSGYARKNELDESLFKAILTKLDISRAHFNKDMADFSGGQKKKVLIAKSLCEQAHLYIWDEPLNFIDVLSRLQIEELLKAHRPTMLFVEHDRAFVERIATKTVILG